MPYGVTLKSRTVYTRIFGGIKKQIKDATFSDIKIEHVGGTSLRVPAGKGDIDIYLAYNDEREKKSLQSILKKLFGKPAKITDPRIRFNFFVDGVEVELQLIDKKSLEAAVTLRNYLNANRLEAKRYAKSIAELRKDSREKMFKIKADFTRKAMNQPSVGRGRRR